MILDDNETVIAKYEQVQLEMSLLGKHIAHLDLPLTSAPRAESKRLSHLARVQPSPCDLHVSLLPANYARQDSYLELQLAALLGHGNGGREPDDL